MCVRDAHRDAMRPRDGHNNAGIKIYMTVHCRERTAGFQHMRQILLHTAMLIKIIDAPAACKHFIVKQALDTLRQSKIKLHPCRVDRPVDIENERLHTAGVQRTEHVQDTNRLCHTPAPSAAAAKAA